jgi:hypothetical protein
MPPPPEIAGLAEIIAAARFLGIPIEDTLRKLADLLATNPPAVQAGGRTLQTLAGGLATGRGDLERAGTGVLSAGFGELAAAEFGPRNAEMVTQVGDTGTELGQLATRFADIAQVFAETHQSVIAATGAAGGALMINKITNSV